MINVITGVCTQHQLQFDQGYSLRRKVFKKCLIVSPFQPSVAIRIETSHLICSACQIHAFL